MTDTILKQVIDQEGIDIYDQNAIVAIICKAENIGTEFAHIDLYVLIGGIDKSYRIAVYDNFDQARKAIELYSRQTVQGAAFPERPSVFRFPSIDMIS